MIFTDQVKQSIGPHADYCDGYSNPGASGKGYVLGLVIGTGVTKAQVASAGTEALDKIIAFDRAEVQSATIGQINMITVSSFCGPCGRIWGYDLARHETIDHPDNLPIEFLQQDDREVRVYKIDPLLEATEALFGTVENPVFPLIPGAHVPCAAKDLAVAGPAHIFAAIAVGIPVDREQNACLLMENIGHLPSSIPVDAARQEILHNTALSILSVGDNQRVKYEKIFVGMKDLKLQEGEVGCALVAAPYFTLAQNAVPKGDPERLLSMRLSDWVALKGKT